MKDVEMMNSCGTRNWVHWVHSLPSNQKVKFVNCSRTFIDQANLFGGFFPKKAIVDSFFIPYFCEACEKTTNVLLTRGKDFNDMHVAVIENVNCATCGKPAESDVIENTYFKFLENINGDKS